MKERKGLDKNMVPEDFSLGLALVDALPVLLFGASALVIGMLFGSTWFLIGAVICFWAGAAKVLWKILVAVKKINIWFLFIQMRIAMPIGFLLILVSLWIDREKVHPDAVIRGICSFPSCVCFCLGVLGMILMSIFAVKLDNGDKRANWIEQITNTAAQFFFFLGLLLL